MTDIELMRRIRLGEDSALKMKRVLLEETRAEYTLIGEDELRLVIWAAE